MCGLDVNERSVDSTIVNRDNVATGRPSNIAYANGTPSLMPWLMAIPMGFVDFIRTMFRPANTGTVAQQQWEEQNIDSPVTAESGNRVRTIVSMPNENDGASSTSFQSVPSSFPVRGGNENDSTRQKGLNTHSECSKTSTVNSPNRESTQSALMRRQPSSTSRTSPTETSKSATSPAGGAGIFSYIYRLLGDKLGISLGNVGKYAAAEDPQLLSRFGSLPPELQLQIFEQLPSRDLVKAQRICQRFERISGEILNGKSDVAREARKEARKARKYARYVAAECIYRLSRETASPAIFKKKVEELIGQHRDISVDISLYGWDGLTPAQVNILLGVLAKQTHLRSLAISEQDFPGKVQHIISTLKKVSSNCNLKELHIDISSPVVTSAQVVSLAKMRTLTSVRLLYSPKIGYRALVALLVNPAITSIYVGTGRLQEGYAEWELVKQALADNETLEELRIIGVSDEALAAIAPALEKNTSLEILILDASRPKSHGMRALGKALEHNTKLTHLKIQFSCVDDAGVAAIAPALEKNTALKCLSLSIYAKFTVNALS